MSKVQPGGLNSDCAMTVHAVLPPPVTGMTLCTESIIHAMSQRVSVRRFNWSNGSPTITPWFRVVKAVRALVTPWKLLFSRRPAHGVFYMPANAGYAALFNMLAMAAARLRGYRCVLHHHYFRYVEKYEWRTKLLTQLLGPQDLELMLCPEMERRFRQLYGPALPLAILPSTVQLLIAGAEPAYIPPTATSRNGPFCIGHITNLQLAKGLDLVIEVLRQLRRNDRDVRLILAGPVDTAVEQRMIDAAKFEFGEAIDYRGPVYQADKRRFFEDIRVIVYPTRNDAQPLVVSESFSFGKPVLSFARGCIPGLMGPMQDWAIPIDGDFVASAVHGIESWMDDPQVYAEASRISRQRYDDLLVDARASLEDFASWICREPDNGFVRRGPSGEVPLS